MSSTLLYSAAMPTVLLAAGEAAINWGLLVSTGIAAITGLWTVYTWRAEKEKERNALEQREAASLRARERQLAIQQEHEEAEERRRAALYTLPFMLAAEALQSRLYNIVAQEGLVALREAYPDGAYADEVLHLMAQYFGWEHCMVRYTKYAYDDAFMSSTRHIGELFATVRFGAGMRVYRNDQIGIGRIALDRYTGEYGVEFDAIGERDFLRKLHEDEALNGVTGRAVQSLRDAEHRSEIEQGTRDRMAALQAELCVLLEGLEDKQGVRVFWGDERKRA
ncbi:MAG: hypothetical protein AAF799_17185 [Myxococcota bacterium]